MVSSGTFEARRGMGMSGGRIARVLPVALVTLVACVRDPLGEPCSDIAEGDLVITEIRGPQTGSFPQWVELYNASDAPIAATGLHLQFTRNDGKSSFAFFVRDEDLTVAPGAYLVLGGGSVDLHSYLDYDYTPDHHSAEYVDVPSDLYPGGTLQLSICGAPIDRIIYAVPPEGTLALDGRTPPDAAANDHSDEGWCADITGKGPQDGVRLNGTPGEANPPCP